MMTVRRWLVPTALLGLLACALVHAEKSPGQRARAFAKLPDWTGIWEQFEVVTGGKGVTESQSAAAQAALTERPPYNTVWQPRADAEVLRQTSSPDAIVCTIGFPGLMFFSPYMFQAIVTPEQTLLVFNARETRHIYTDGRVHPPLEDLLLTPWGHSIGHWEGQTLVPDTIGTTGLPMYFEEERFLTAPLSETARYRERLRMTDTNTLEDQIEVIDPVSLRSVWKLSRQYHRVPNLTELVEEDCLGNDRDPVVNGKFTLAPPASAK